MKMMGKKKSVMVAPRPPSYYKIPVKKVRVNNKSFAKPKMLGFVSKFSRIFKYIAFFALLLFLVLVIYLLTNKAEVVSSKLVYGALGLAAGFLVLLNIYFFRKYYSRIKEFFSKFKRAKKKEVVGVVVDDAKKVVERKVKVKPKLMLFVTFFVLAVISLLVLNSRGIISFSNPYVLLALGVVFFASLVRVSLGFYRTHNAKSKIQEQLSKENINVIQKSIVAKSSKYKTDLDRLYELINENGKVTLSDVAKGFKISVEMAEEWARILGSHDLITINYPPFGEMELCKK